MVTESSSGRCSSDDGEVKTPIVYLKNEKWGSFSKQGSSKFKKNELQRLLEEYQVRDYIHMVKLRSIIPIWLFGLICGYLIVVLAIVILSAIVTLNFKLNNSILITLLTTTTATVLGLFVLILKYLFPSNDN